MMKYKKYLSARNLLIAGLVLYAALKIQLLLLHHDIRWDEAVYLTMGKYLLSAGELGFWESLRPPLWPVLLAVYQAIGDPVLLGEITNALLGGLGATLLYLTLKEHVNNYLATATALLLLFSNIWFWYSSALLTGIASATLIIAGYYAHSKERPLLAGVLLAAAFLTRFPAGMGFAALFAAMLLDAWPKRNTYVKQKTLPLPLVKFVLGFLIPVLGWMTINAFTYSQYGTQAPIQPLLAGSGNVFFMNVWLHNTSLLYYFTQLLWWLPVSILAVFGITSSYKNTTLSAYAILAALSLGFFTILPNNQWRFALLILPGVLVLAALGAHKLSKKNRYFAAIIAAALIINLGALILHDYNLLSDRGEQPSPIEENYYRFIEEHPVNGTIYVSDPIVAWYAPNKAIPIYYEQLKDADALTQQEAAAVFYVPRSAPCAQHQTNCTRNVEEFTEHLIEEYRLVHNTTLHGYRYFVFSNQIDLPAQNTPQVREAITYVQENPE